MSIGSEGNKKLFRALNKLNDEEQMYTDLKTEDKLLGIESWEKLKGYPRLNEADLTKPADLELLAWVVETFMTFVCAKQTSGVTKKDRNRVRTVEFYDRLFDHMTLDELVFMFVQVENNINKWRMVWKAFKETLVPAWEKHDEPEDCECNKKSLAGKQDYDTSWRLVSYINEEGCEYPLGSGIAGRDGRRRCKHLKEYFSDHYFDLGRQDVKEQVLANRKALIAAVKSYAKTKGRVPETEAELDAEESSRRKDRGAQEPNQDITKLRRIADAMWDELEESQGSVGVVQV